MTKIYINLAIFVTLEIFIIKKNFIILDIDLKLSIFILIEQNERLFSIIYIFLYKNIRFFNLINSLYFV